MLVDRPRHDVGKYLKMKQKHWRRKFKTVELFTHQMLIKANYKMLW